MSPEIQEWTHKSRSRINNLYLLTRPIGETGYTCTKITQIGIQTALDFSITAFLKMLTAQNLHSKSSDNNRKSGRYSRVICGMIEFSGSTTASAAPFVSLCFISSKPVPVCVNVHEFAPLEL